MVIPISFQPSTDTPVYMVIPISFQPSTDTPVYWGIEVTRKVPFLTDRPDDPVELCMKKIVIVYGLYKITKIAIKIFIVLPFLMVCAVGNLLKLLVNVVVATFCSKYFAKNQFPKIEMLQDLIAIIALPIIALLSAFFDRLPPVTRVSKNTRDNINEDAVYSESNEGYSLYGKFIRVKDWKQKKFQEKQDQFTTEELKTFLEHVYHVSEFTSNYERLFDELIIALSLSKKKLEVDKKFHELVQDLIKQGIDYSTTDALKWVVLSKNIELLETLVKADSQLLKRALNTPDSQTKLTPVFALIDDYFHNQNLGDAALAKETLNLANSLFYLGSDPNVIKETETQFMQFLSNWNVTIEYPGSYSLQVFRTFVGFCIEYSPSLDIRNFSLINFDIKRHVAITIAKGVHLNFKRADWIPLIEHHENLLGLLASATIAQNPNGHKNVKAIFAQAIRIAILLGKTNAVKELQKGGAQLEYYEYLFLDELYKWASLPIHAPLRIKPIDYSDYCDKHTALMQKSVYDTLVKMNPTERAIGLQKLLSSCGRKEVAVKPITNEEMMKYENEFRNAPSEIMIQSVSFMAIQQQIKWFIQTPIGIHHDVAGLNKVLENLKNRGDLYWLKKDGLDVINKVISVFNNLLHFNRFWKLPMTIQQANPVLAAFIEDLKTMPQSVSISQDTQKCLSDLKQIYDPIFAKIKQEILLRIAPADIKPLVDMIVEYSNGDHHVKIEQEARP